MNKIRAIQALNEKEIDQGISTDASWHTDYRDTAFVYFGGLPYEISEGDVITIFSQFGEPVFLKLARDKETGKSRGFGWLKYEDQRSSDLAVDNLGGANIGGRLISVDHARYKARDDEDPEEFKIGWEDMRRKQGLPVTDDESSASENDSIPQLPEEQELARLLREHDDEDPMKTFLVEEQRKAVEKARRRSEKKDQKHKHKHKHHSSEKHRQRPRSRTPERWNKPPKGEEENSPRRRRKMSADDEEHGRQRRRDHLDDEKHHLSRSHRTLRDMPPGDGLKLGERDRNGSSRRSRSYSPIHNHKDR